MSGCIDVVEVGGDLIEVVETSFDVIETVVDGFIEVQDTDLDVITMSGDEIVVEGVGTQGPPGPAGPPGAPGGSYFLYSGTAATWVIDHNLGHLVHVTLLDSVGNVVYADVEESSVNQVTVTFRAPFTGTAILS